MECRRGDPVAELARQGIENAAKGPLPAEDKAGRLGDN